MCKGFALQKQSEKTETLELKAMVTALQRSEDRGSGTRAVPKPSGAWNVVTAKGVLKKNGAGKGTGKNDEGQKRDVNRLGVQHPCSERNKEARNTHSTRGRVQVTGARRIWGTVKVITSALVKTTIQRLFTVEEGVSVKRKYKTAGDDSKHIIRWWFIVRGEEETLQRLQSERPQIAVQTAWKMELLLSYCTPNDVPHSVQIPPQQSHNSILYSSAQLSPARQPPSVNDVHPPHSSAQSKNHIELASCYLPAVCKQYASIPVNRSCFPQCVNATTFKSRAFFRRDEFSNNQNLDNIGFVVGENSHQTLTSGSIDNGNNRTMSVIYFNTRSFIPKFDELCLLVEAQNPNIYILESWLCTDIPDTKICIPRYQLFRKDRNRHGGGVLLYIRDIFTAKILPFNYVNNLDILRVVAYRLGCKFCITTLSRPPNSPSSIFGTLYSYLMSLKLMLLPF